jgi:hypothetical protein
MCKMLGGGGTKANLRPVLKDKYVALRGSSL